MKRLRQYRPQAFLVSAIPEAVQTPLFFHLLYAVQYVRIDIEWGIYEQRRGGGGGIERRRGGESGAGFGLSIIEMLAEQLHGSSSWVQENVTRCVVQFPL